MLSRMAQAVAQFAKRKLAGILAVLTRDHIAFLEAVGLRRRSGTHRRHGVCVQVRTGCKQRQPIGLALGEWLVRLRRWFEDDAVVRIIEITVISRVDGLAYRS